MPESVHTTLNDLARAKIEALAGEGIVCTPDDVVLLNRLAWEIETPAHRLSLARGTPVFLGDVALWPLTLAAEAWWQRAIAFTRREARQTALLAFAMAHCRNQKALDAINPLTAYKQAEKWANNLPCRRQELFEAISQILEQETDTPTVPDPKAQIHGMTAPQMVAVLVAVVGGTPAMWEREVAVGYLREQFRTIHAQMAAEHGQTLRDSECIEGTRQLGLATEAIRRRNSPNQEPRTKNQEQGEPHVQ